MPWDLTGNAGLGTADFLGTTDNQPLVIQTHGNQALRITPAGTVGIGIVQPPLYAGLNVANGSIAIGTHPTAVGSDPLNKADAAIHVFQSFGTFDRLLQMG